MIISIEGEKGIFQNITPVYDKNYSKLGVEIFLNLIINIYKNPTVCIILNGEKHKALPPRLGTKQRCFLSCTAFLHCTEISN